MPDEAVHLLDARGRTRGHRDQRVGELRHRALAAAGHASGDEPPRPRRLESVKNVWASTRSGYCEGDVAWPAEGFDLSRKNALKAEVIPAGGEDARIGAQGDRGNRRAILPITHDEFAGQMLRVGGAPAIAEEEDLAAARDAAHPGIEHPEKG